MDEESGRGSSWSRQWRGNHHTWMRAYTREYDFPVETFRVGPNGERIKVETGNR